MWEDPSAREGVLACLDRGQTSNVEISGTSSFGKSLRVRLYFAPLHDRDGTVRSCMIMCEDVASQRDLEEQLAQSHKLEALGRLAGGIAHDFNNLLTVVSGFSEAVHANLDDRPDDQEDLAQVLHAAKRAAELTRQLLAFSRKQVIQSAVFDLNGLAERLETMLQRLIGEDVELEMKLFEGPLLVNADQGQIEQVFLNLVVNALDAMHSGGRLEISTRLDGSPSGRPGEPHAVLSVEDSGTGIEPEILKRIFDPFFTTKETGKGTGLGLATASGIVQQCGGELRVTSELGAGSRFEVLLPQSSAGLESALPEATLPDAVKAGDATILIVEDEWAVRDIVRATIEGAGYRTLMAQDGVAALAVAEGHADPIDLLLTDFPLHFSGYRLAFCLRSLQPGHGRTKLLSYDCL